MASILGAETGQMTLSALFNPLAILSCALLAVYIGLGSQHIKITA